MSLAQLLADKSVKNAVIIDDSIDPLPIAADLSGLGDEWAVFNDDLSRESREKLDAALPELKGASFQEKIQRDDFVAAVWGMRDELGELAEPLFETYLANQQADLKYVDLAQQRLEALGLNCTRAGRSFADAVQDADLVLIDLYLGGAQNQQAYDLSKKLLAEAVERRSDRPPLVVLMSRSTYLTEKRDEFRDDAGLLDSGFRILSKSELEIDGRLERQLDRLALNANDTRKLAKFVSALQDGMAGAAERTLTQMRRLRLSDIGQVQQLLLQFEGEPAGSYLVDIFDRLLQHEIEADDEIIASARALNDFKSTAHQAPYAAGSPDLQELVYRTLAQNDKRLTLRSSPEFPVAFGDILALSPPVGNDAKDAAQERPSLPVEIDPVADVLLVLTPACDLQRGEAKRVLLLVGRRKAVSWAGWSYGSGARTPAIRIADDLVTIDWDLKHIDTISWTLLRESLDKGRVKVVARLREAHALELQQKLLSGLGRVGIVATMPASFPVALDAWVPGADGVPKPLEVPALAEGAVLFVGRDGHSNRVQKLVVTEVASDALDDALRQLDDDAVAPDALKPLQHIRATGDLGKLLAEGIDLSKLAEGKWLELAIRTQSNTVSQMGRVAWNAEMPTGPLGKNLLMKSGVMLLISDAKSDVAPLLSDLVGSGDVELVKEEVQPAEAGDRVQSRPKKPVMEG